MQRSDVQPIANAIRSAIEVDDRTIFALARESGLLHENIYEFMNNKSGLTLATVDKLFAPLRLGVVRLDNVGDPETSDPTQTLSGGMRSALVADGRNFVAIARETGIHLSNIHRFAHGGGLLLSTAEKLFVTLGLKLVRLDKTGGSEAEVAAPPQPIADAIRTGIEVAGLSPGALARLTGVHDGTIRKFRLGGVGLRLSAADKIAFEVGLKLVRPAEAEALQTCDPARPLSDRIRSAIEADDRGLNTIAREAGIHSEAIRKLIGEQGDVALSTAEKLFVTLGLKLVREPRVRPPKPKPPKAPPPEKDPRLDELRAEIARRGITTYALARQSGVSHQTIMNLNRGRNLRPANFNKLANALGLDLETARPQILSAEVSIENPTPTRRCPVELRGEGFPIVVEGEDPLPHIKGDAYNMLDLLIKGFYQGRRVPASELAALSESKRIRPLIDALERPGFDPLFRRIRISKVGRNKFLEILDTNPGH
jgi:DNA-binding phage protein/transcriptional regulator with XRE-family HTH domain